jgi:hypothetical protein
VYYGSRRVGQEPRSSLIEEGERIEAPFGQALMRSGEGGAYLLTLHELQDLSGLFCIGDYIPPSVPTVAEIELLARHSAMEETQSRLVTTGTADYRRFQDNTTRPTLSGEATLSDSREGAERWTGRVGRTFEPRVGFSFSLERYGSPEIALTLMAMFFLLYFGTQADRAAETCYKQALEACGQGEVRNFKISRTLGSITEGGFVYDCEWECK